MAGYPSDAEADIVLRDGSTAHVRPVRPADEERLHSFLEGLSIETRSFRFFSGGADLRLAARAAADVDHHDRYGLLATSGDHVIAHAAYVRTGDDIAEVAFEIADASQGLGIGTVLLGQLAEAAAARGIDTFTAVVLPGNVRMLDVFRDSGFPLRTRAGSGEVLIEMPTALTGDALDRFEQREHISAVAAVRSLLAPHAVAVIGASRHRGTIGGEVFHNLIASGFTGPVYPVNPKATVVQSVAAYPSLDEIPGPVDLAVIVVPAPDVLEVARACAAKGVRALVVISSGFAETGGEGVDRQRDLLALCRDMGMRLVGPNCMGIINTADAVRLNATFTAEMPPPGRVGFMTQSGALGLAVIQQATELGLGLSSFVSVGNKADLSGNDLIRFWEDDEATDLILLYLESFGNPRKFSRIARQVARHKPIIAVKSGRSVAGARATSSHTGALLAASDVTVDALFRQTGVIRTETLAEMFDVASLLANQPAPAGDRVAIITNAGGPGIMCADTCEGAGLRVPGFSDDLQQRLAEALPREASVVNPVDMIASATGADYRRTIEQVAASGEADAIIVIFIRPLVTRTEDVARAIRDAAARVPRTVPLLAVFMSEHGVPDELRGDGVRIPSFTFPEDAARALARAARYGTWRASPLEVPPVFDDVRMRDASALLDGSLVEGPRWLDAEAVAELCSCYGIPLAPWRVAGSPEEAEAAARALGAPVALKAIASGLLHKTDAGGVALHVAPDGAAARAREMREHLTAAGFTLEGFLVQPMVPPGPEMLVGVVHDPSFGPVLACGAGGTAVELRGDVSVGLTPLTASDASRMLRSLATFPLLDGYRGAARADVAALEDLVLRVSTMVETHREIAELDLNPVVVHPRGVTVVDARVRVEMSPAPPPLSSRRR